MVFVVAFAIRIDGGGVEKSGKFFTNASISSPLLKLARTLLSQDGLVASYLVEAATQLLLGRSSFLLLDNLASLGFTFGALFLFLLVLDTFLFTAFEVVEFECCGCKAELFEGGSRVKSQDLA